jgi:uncharacterized protein (DUF736 family)
MELKMAYEKRHGDVTLFANDRKSKDTQPDWRGTIHIQGKDYEIALWNRTSKSGKTFISGKMGDEAKPPEARGSFPNAQRPAPKPASSIQDGLNDDLPW